MKRQMSNEVRRSVCLNNNNKKNRGAKACQIRFTLPSLPTPRCHPWGQFLPLPGCKTVMQCTLKLKHLSCCKGLITHNGKGWKTILTQHQDQANCSAEESSSNIPHILITS